MAGIGWFIATQKGGTGRNANYPSRIEPVDTGYQHSGEMEAGLTPGKPVEFELVAAIADHFGFKNAIRFERVALMFC
jgi:hypothetical protein